MPRKVKSKAEAPVATQEAPAPAPASQPQPIAPAKPQLPKGSRGKGRVFLIDAMSFIFRAYHAMARQRPMSTKTGIPTAATYVFVNMLRKLRADFKPEYIAAVFDVGAPTFRDQQAAAITSVRKYDSKTQQFQDVAYDGYKANRSAMPDDLAQQVPYIRRALEAYRIPILEYAGYEADDLIGTLAQKAAKAGHPVYVVSSDKDMLQLVNERVCVLNPPKDNLICDRAAVEQILGVPPERVVDVMALRGDSIDNIPGAPGIGDKGSVELIQRFGTVEAALDHAAEVERKTYRESLLNNRDVVLKSKELVTIDCNVPVELDVEAMTARDPDSNSARALFTELEFTTLAKDFAPTLDLGERKYTEAESAADVERVLARVSAEQPLTFVLEAQAEAPPAAEEEEEDEEAEETSGKLPLSAPPPETAAQPARRVAVSSQPGEALTLSLDDGGASLRLRKALADPNLPKATHDLKSALRVLARKGLALAGVADDALLYSYLLDPTYSSHSLAAVALRRFNLKLEGGLAESADVAGRLITLLRGEVAEAGLRGVYDDIDLPLAPVLARMEIAGVKIDCGVLAAMSRRLEREVNAKAREIYDKAGTEFNINSPRQLGDVLFNKLALPKPVKYGKGKTISTAVDVLEGLAAEHEVPRLVLEYRQLSKLKSTYVDALPALCDRSSGRLHTTFNQAGTATGRLSSTNPNLQNIPIRTELGREIRAAFVAEKGNVLLAADYSQIELRLLAHFSEDPLLTEAFRRGDDIHTLTASQVFGVPPLMINAEHRRRAKAVNFGIVYGLSPFGLSQQLGIETKEAKQFIDAYFARYTGVRRFIDRTLDEARRDGKVRTLFGRVRPIPDINSKNTNMRGFAERTAVNTPLQGTAADLIKLAMIRIDRELAARKLRAQMTLQVHDELVFEVPESEVDTVRALVGEQMERVHALRVPLVVEVGVGPNWRDLE
ncbi:MAG TPA: DNA polymerase I [Terriglobales bacterium]|nr:DNA polymerase I [Terriglobales bacterium]